MSESFFSSFTWVLLNDKRDRIRGTGNQVLPPEYFNNPEKIISFHFFKVNDKGEELLSIGVDVVKGFFFIGNTMFNPSMEILNREPKPNYRLIYARHWFKEMIMVGGKSTVRQIFLGFKIGWQTTLRVEVSEKYPRGLRNYVRIMYIDSRNCIIDIRKKK